MIVQLLIVILTFLCYILTRKLKDNGSTTINITPTNPSRAKYFVVPDSGNGVGIVDEKRVIKSGKIFVYIN